MSTTFTSRLKARSFRPRRRLSWKFAPKRVCLPYGVWVRDDGSLVLFNRNYCPIWDRSADGEVSEIGCACADANVTTGYRDKARDCVWIEWVEQHHFFDDGNPPWADRATKKMLTSVLADFQAGKPIDHYWKQHDARRWRYENRLRLIGGAP
jgi:hypothetical protein